MRIMVRKYETAVFLLSAILDFHFSPKRKCALHVIVVAVERLPRNCNYTKVVVD